MLGMSVASVGERVACARVRRRLCTGGKRIRTLGPRYVNDAIETILIAGLAFAFLPERPARSQGGTDGSNPLSSSGESHCEPAGHPLKGSRPKPRRVRAPASAIRRRAGTNRAASWPRSGGIRASCTRASASSSPICPAGRTGRRSAKGMRAFALTMRPTPSRVCQPRSLPDVPSLRESRRNIAGRNHRDRQPRPLCLPHTHRDNRFWSRHSEP
jgi:hypothetical protein